MVWTGLLAAVAAVLCVSGLAKLRHADASRPALAALGLPAGRGAVWILGAVELTVGVGALGLSSAAVATAVALWYLGLTVASAALVRHRSGAAGVSCGCFGTGSTPPHAVQVVANAGSALVAGVAALMGADALAAAVAASPAPGTVLALQTAVAAVLVVAVHRELPAVLRPRPSPPSFRLRSTR